MRSFLFTLDILYNLISSISRAFWHLLPFRLGNIISILPSTPKPKSAQKSSPFAFKARFAKYLVLITSFAHATPPPDYFSVATGVYNLLQDKWRTQEFDLEYKFHLRCLKSPNPHLEFRPLIGALMTMRGTKYFYAGINFDLLFWDHVLFAPGFAAGYWIRGDGRDLGFPLEFRSGIELAWQFCDKSRLGVHFYHLSNASIGHRNPGEESFVLFYDIPITKGFPFK